ncbi:hypothetical protein SAMN05518671_0782 [Stenotrophomonas lactitubi]|nr:hypothetical protein SAMN04487863_2646 [Stenotrophomonas sp. yr243]SNS49649.1 hypothetical protein SAMN05518671_0782 [Stenotrophomonas lactitubi]
MKKPPKGGFFIAGSAGHARRAQRRVFGRVAPCTRRGQGQSLKPKRLRVSAGWAGRCGLAGHAVNPSLGARWRHPWRQRSCQPTPPHPRQFPAAVGRCRPWSTRSIHAMRGWDLSDLEAREGTRLLLLPLLFFFLSVAGGTAAMCQGPGGWGWRGCPRHGCRGQAPMDGFTASLASPTRPANPTNPAGALRDQPAPATRGCAVG